MIHVPEFTLLDLPDLDTLAWALDAHGQDGIDALDEIETAEVE